MREVERAHVDLARLVGVEAVELLVRVRLGLGLGLGLGLLGCVEAVELLPTPYP